MIVALTIEFDEIVLSFDSIEKFTYENKMYEDDLIRFTVASTDAEETLKELTINDNVIIRFGYAHGELSPVIEGRVTDISMQYTTTGVSLDISCLDEGNFMKKTSSLKVWKNMTASEIAEAIAIDYNLDFFITTTTERFDYPQAGRDDFEMLTELAHNANGGFFVFYVSNRVLYFKKRSTDRDSTITYTLFSPNSRVRAFNPKFTISQSTPKANQIAIRLPPGLDALPNLASVDNNTEAKEPGTGGSYKFDIHRREVGNNPDVIDEPELLKTKASVIDPRRSMSEALARANSLKKEEQFELVTATLNVIGNPTIQPDTVLTIAGIDNMFSGNWYVTGVTHDISTGNGYTTTIELNKNASEKDVRSPDSPFGRLEIPLINGTIGPPAEEQEGEGPPEYTFDIQRRIVGEDTEDYKPKG